MTRIIKGGEMMDTDDARAGILSMPDFAAEARNIVLEARKDAARIMSEAHAKAEAIQREARQKGYSEGFARGQTDGHAEGHQEARADAHSAISGRYSELLEWAGEVVQGLSAARDESRRGAAGEVLEMAILLAEKIVNRVAAVDVEAARANLAKVVERAHFTGEAVVKVNPGQLEDLRDSFGDLVDALGAGGTVRLTGDERVSPGGVKLVSRHGQIDATIETQLANVARALLGDAGEPERTYGEHDPSEGGLYEPMGDPATESSRTA
jgi:flagellar assembly protein FliH